MDQTDDFSADPFFNDGSLPQIDGSVEIDGLNTVPLPSSPFVVERILNLQACGCLNRIAWSRGGHIARIAEDGVHLDFHHLVFDDNIFSWKLGPKRTENLDLGELVSLAWSPSGSDLAVVDFKGRVSIFRPSSLTSNRFTQFRSGNLDETDDLSQAIGLHWLSQDSPDRPVWYPPHLMSLSNDLENCSAIRIEDGCQVDTTYRESKSPRPSLSAFCRRSRSVCQIIPDLYQTRWRVRKVEHSSYRSKCLIYSRCILFYC